MNVKLRREEPAGPLEEVELRRSGRYEVLGRIAAGGVGQVLKAHDGDLGRDVAIKMLHERHLANPDLVQRFVEEAQIGGQLQHPGVVPVYELGLHEGDQPFFAMKLIKGRSLAALLAERTDPAERRHRFLAVYLQACEAMAYAHSRGVIHRDLKPSNLMVGAFGDVQVVDWGFAKVISQGGVADERRAKQAEIDRTRIATVRSDAEGSHSVAGSVMGTPAYMPPEQALGHVEDLDERSDVFALGAILCEILTGKPPYVGAPMEVLAQAAEGRLDDAHARLDGCGRDPRLIELAKRCLQALRQGRPRSAAELTGPIAQHLADVDGRAQRSKLAAIEARRRAAEKEAAATEERARAEAAAHEARAARDGAAEERLKASAAEEQARAQRRANRLTMAAAAALLVLVGAGAGGFAWVRGARAQRERSTAAEVRPLLEDARSLKGEAKWDEALRIADRAVELAGEADPVTRQEAATVRDGVVAARETSARSAADARRRREFLETVEELRLRIGGPFEPQETAAALARAFDGYGLDVSATARTAAAIRALGDIASRVAAVVDDWARIDARPRELAAALKADTPAVRGMALLSAGSAGEAVALLRQNHFRNPGDRFANARLGLALTRLVPPRRAEALRYLAAAQYGFPRSAAMRELIRNVEENANDLDGFRGDIGYADPDAWISFTIRRSVVTGQRRRIYFNKGRVTLALLGHAGGEEWTAAPMVYPDRTDFVAENLDPEGHVVDTEILRIRAYAPPEFFLFDADGRLIREIERKNGNPTRLVAPRDCMACHTGTGYYDPMQSFPGEPANQAIDIEAKYRDLKITVKFLEGYHRGGRLFGPYGAIWMSRLKAGAKTGELSDADRRYHAALAKKYPELLGD